MEQSGPLHRLAAKISEIKAGLGSVQNWLEQKSPNFGEAESTQKVRHLYNLIQSLYTLILSLLPYYFVNYIK